MKYRFKSAEHHYPWASESTDWHFYSAAGGTLETGKNYCNYCNYSYAEVTLSPVKHHLLMDIEASHQIVLLLQMAHWRLQAFITNGFRWLETLALTVFIFFQHRGYSHTCIKQIVFKWQVKLYIKHQTCGTSLFLPQVVFWRL